MNNLIKALFLALPLALMGCDDTYDTTVSTAGYPNGVNNGCIVVSDAEFGEREICSQHYMVNNGYVWWDQNYGLWISSYGFYHRGGVWVRGYPLGYREYYHGYYHPRGFYSGHGYFVGRGGYAPRGFRGNGWHGSYHSGGGGNHFGGHGGHR